MSLASLFKIFVPHPLLFYSLPFFFFLTFCYLPFLFICVWPVSLRLAASKMANDLCLLLFVLLWKFPPSWVSVGPSNSFLMNRICKRNGIWLQKWLWQPFCLLLHPVLLWKQQTTMLLVACGEVHLVRNWCLWPTVSKGLRPVNSHISELEADSFPVGPEMNAALADTLCLVTLSWRPWANSQKLR